MRGIIPALPPAPAPLRSRFLPVTALAMAVSIATLVAFSPVSVNEFINYDDNRMLVQNPHVRSGLSAENLRWAFSNTDFENWIPLTWLSHQLDFQLFGAHPGAHHLVSAFLHAANAALLLVLLHALTGKLQPAAVVAALFALHPLRVQSVAWAAERKDVLCALLAFLALAVWLRFVRRRGAGAYAAALGLFAAALMAKPMIVTLPALLLLIDFWPLGRWGPGRFTTVPARVLFLEKLPFLLLSVVAGVVTFLAQRGAGAVAYAVEYPLASRIPNAFRSYGVYLWKTILPVRLSIFYPYFWEDVPLWQPVLGFTCVAVLTVSAIRLLRRRPAFAVGWFWFLGTLVPVIGVVQAGSQALADRYTYLPQIGLFIALAWALREAWVRLPQIRPALLGAVPLVLALLGATTWVEASRWRTSETIFRHALAVTENNYVAATNLGAALAEQGRVAEANELISRSFAINPFYRAEVFQRGGDYYARLGMKREAAEQYRKALAIVPYDRLVRERLRELGGVDSQPPAPAPAPPPAVAVTRTPEAARQAYVRGNQLAGAGRREEAVAAYREAIRLAPGSAEAWHNLGTALAELGRLDEADEALAEALRLNPGYESARGNLKAIQAYRNRRPGGGR